MHIDDLVKAYNKAQKNNCEHIKSNLDQVTDYLSENIPPNDFSKLIVSLERSFHSFHQTKETNEDIHCLALHIVMTLLEHKTIVKKVLKCPELQVEFL